MHYCAVTPTPAHAPVPCQPQAARAERVRELVERDIT